ncbi:MAG: hypothetical protein DRK00_08790 [Thermoprotei archaeon]|nr:MAG: hypothetical protein DRK00_08790 [Thermoprotei archaeon]
MRELRRKGISPVIAVLLLIVIAVAAAILTYVWLTGYMGTLQSQAGTQQVQERIKIEGVKIDTDNDQVDAVYVRNIGDVSVKIADIYIMDSSGNVIEKISKTTTLNPENTSTITVDMSTKLSEGSTYIVKVVTARGTEVTYQFTYRK